MLAKIFTKSQLFTWYFSNLVLHSAYLQCFLTIYHLYSIWNSTIWYPAESNLHIFHLIISIFVQIITFCLFFFFTLFISFSLLFTLLSKWFQWKYVFVPIAPAVCRLTDYWLLLNQYLSTGDLVPAVLLVSQSLH